MEAAKFKYAYEKLVRSAAVATVMQKDVAQISSVRGRSQSQVDSNESGPPGRPSRTIKVLIKTGAALKEPSKQIKAMSGVKSRRRRISSKDEGWGIRGRPTIRHFEDKKREKSIGTSSSQIRDGTKAKFSERPTGQIKDEILLKSRGRPKSQIKTEIKRIGDGGTPRVASTRVNYKMSHKSRSAKTVTVQSTHKLLNETSKFSVHGTMATKALKNPQIIHEQKSSNGRRDSDNKVNAMLTKSSLDKLDVVKSMKGQKRKMTKLYSKAWEGNSDSEGSIDSACLDEDICFTCGKNTKNEENWENLLLCDRCDGEHHLSCVYLEVIPRKGWVCPACKEEIREFEGLTYNVQGVGFNLVRKRKRGLGTSEDEAVVYSPSRPLEMAWEECQQKGFMVVAKVLSYDVMRKM